ncbi:hypothetical protein, partial [Paracraurococcus lichenis]
MTKIKFALLLAVTAVSFASLGTHKANAQVPWGTGTGGAFYGDNSVSLNSPRLVRPNFGSAFDQPMRPGFDRMAPMIA